MLLSEKAMNMERILLDDLPKVEKIIQAAGAISGLELTKLTTSVRRNIERQLVFFNTLLQQYNIKTCDDYIKIAPAHLDKIIQMFKRVCRLLKKFAETNDFVNATSSYERTLAG